MTTHPTHPTSNSTTNPVRRPQTATRTDAAVAWVIWHAGELAAVGVPLLLAVAVSWWFVLLAVLAGAAWTVREVRTTTAPVAGPTTVPITESGAAPAALTKTPGPVGDQAGPTSTEPTDQTPGCGRGEEATA